MNFTTSWDDGYEQDFRIAELLERHGMTGTFYVCPQAQHGQVMLKGAEIKRLALRHEIGAHSLSHPKLAKIPADEARKEIAGSKQWIEERTDRECTIFCYPYGSENAAVRTLVREAGFHGARTTEMLRFTLDDPFGMPTSLHVYPFPWRGKFTQPKHFVDPLGPWRVHRKRLGELGVPLTAQRSFLTLGKRVFTDALQRNEPFFHLWGHSEEVMRLGLWDDLEELISFIAGHSSQLHYVPNSALLPSQP